MKNWHMIPRHLLALSDLFRCWFLYWAIRLLKGRTKAVEWMNPGFARWGRRYRAIYQLRSDVHGLELLADIDWAGRHVFFVGNHQSFADIPTLLAAAEVPVGFMAKKELWKIPFLGFWMDKLGCVGVDRAKPSSAIRTLKELDKAGDRRRLAVFPEGTRSTHGQMNEWKDGALKLIWSVKPIVVPFVLRGTRNAVEDRGGSLKWCQAHVDFLAPMDLATLDKSVKFEDWKESMRSQIDAVLRAEI